MQDSHARYARAVLGTDDGLWEWIVSTGEDYLSPRWKGLLGYTDDELTNHQDSFFSLLHPDDIPLVQNAIQAHFERDMPFDLDFRLRTKAEGYRWFRSRGRVERDKGGQPWRMSGVMSDIHDAKVAQEELRRANEELQRMREELERRVEERTIQLRQVSDRLLLATRAGHVGIWDWNVTENILLWDEAMYRLYGISVDLFGGAYEAWQTGVHPEDREQADLEIQLALQGKKEFDTEFRVLWPNGEIRYIKAYGLIQRDASGQATRLLGTNWDITERKRIEQMQQEANDLLERRVAERTSELLATTEVLRASEERYRQLAATLEKRVEERTAELQAAYKELEAFSYSVSHDLRAPLRAIDGFSRIILDDFGDQMPAEALEYLHDVRNNVQRMGRLVSDLLAFSRLGRQSLRKQTINVDALVRLCWEDCKTTWKERQITFRIGSLPPCEADYGLLRQVWLNLLGNAIKYTSKRQEAIIEVDCQDDGENVVYFIRDNGVGFDMRYADNLFGVFQRLHRAEEYEGTGVGLATVHRIIQRHGGHIWAEAETEKGATFLFSLPGVEAIAHE